MVQLSKTITSLDFNKLITIASPAIAPVVFVASVASKEIRAGVLKMPTNLQELMEEGAKAIDIVASRITGFSPLGRVKAPRTFRLANLILNPYIWAAVAVQFGVPFVNALIPGAGKILNPLKRLVTIAAVPGTIGAVFDDPPTQTRNTGHTDITGMASQSMLARLQPR